MNLAVLGCRTQHAFLLLCDASKHSLFAVTQSNLPVFQTHAKGNLVWTPFSKVWQLQKQLQDDKWHTDLLQFTRITLGSGNTLASLPRTPGLCHEMLSRIRICQALKCVADLSAGLLIPEVADVELLGLCFKLQRQHVQYAEQIFACCTPAVCDQYCNYPRPAPSATESNNESKHNGPSTCQKA